MDRAYEGNETRQLAFDLASFRLFLPTPIDSLLGITTALCIAAANEVERLFRRLKGFRRIFSRFDKLDVMFTAFIQLRLSSKLSGSVNRP